MTVPTRAPRGAGGRSATPRRTRRPAGRTGAPSRPAVRDEVSELERALDAAAGTAPPPSRTFAELGLPPGLIAALGRAGIEAPFAIQERTLPDALAGRDILGRARTGSGKTLAFGLPMLARLVPTGSGPTRRVVRGLVLVPTRELARQVADVIGPLATVLGLKVTAVYGGAPMGRQIEALHRGVDIVVATPGRLTDLIDRGVCSLDQVEVAVLDEADHMADLGFLPAVVRLLDDTPETGQRMLFSATLDRGVTRLVRAYLHEPAVHAVALAAGAVLTAEHRVFVLPSKDKVAVAAQMVGRPARTLLFVRTKHGADRLVTQLGRAGVVAAALHGNLNQNQRQRALDGFAAGHPRVLVATDVAARGIHVDDVDLVVHYDPPSDPKDYLHRSGRTARAGASGTVVTLVEPEQVGDLTRLHRAAEVTATRYEVAPDHDAVLTVASSGQPIPPQPPPTVRPAAAGNPSGAPRRSHPRRGDGPRRADQRGSQNPAHRGQARAAR